MYLYAQKAFRLSINCIVVGDITHQDAVDVMLQAIAFDNQMKVIPIFGFDFGWLKNR